MYELSVDRKMECNTTSRHVKIADGKIFIDIIGPMTDHDHLDERGVKVVASAAFRECDILL